MNKLLIFLILLLVTISSSNVFADYLVDDFFSDFDISVCDVGLRDCMDKDVTYYYSSYIDEETLGTISTVSFEELGTSISKDSVSNKTQFLIFICDTAFETSDMRCDSQNISAVQKDKLLESGRDRIALYEDINPTIIALPESYFVDLSKNVELVGIFRSLLDKSTSEGLELSSVNVTQNSSLTREVLLFIILTLTGVVVLHKISLGKISLNKLTKLYKSFINFFIENNKIALYVLILGSFTYVFLLSLVSYIDMGSIDILYIFSYVTEVTNPALLSKFIVQGQMLKTLLFFYTFTLTFAFFLYILPELYKIRDWRDTLKGNKTNINVYIVTVLCMILILTLFVSGLEFGFWKLFVLTSLLYISFMSRTHINLSLISKLFLFGVFVLILGLGIFVRIYVPSYKNQNNVIKLNKDSDSLFLGLPLQIHFKENSLVENLEVKVDKDIYIGEYLLYSKENFVVNNLPLQDFDPSKPFKIKVASYSDFLPEFHNNIALQSALFTEQPSVLSEAEINIRGEYDLLIDLKCSGNVKDGSFELRNYVVEDIGIIRRNDKEYVLPACRENSKKELKYSIALDLPESSTYFVVLPTSGYEIENIELSRVQNSVPLNFYDTYRTFLSFSPEINIYSDAYKSKFTTSRVGEYVDISGPLNELISEGTLRGSLYLDSPEGVLLRISE